MPERPVMQLGSGSLADLPRLRDYRRQRLSSWDRSGGNLDAIQIPAGETAVLGEIEGAGCVKHVWMTLMSLPDEPAELRRCVLRAFWDGEASPSVEAPLGDFFGIGFGLRRNFSSLPLQMSPQDGKGMNCWFPMPFADGARFEVENPGESLRILFFYIDYEEYRGARPRPRPLPRLVEPPEPDGGDRARARLHPRRLPPGEPLGRGPRPRRPVEPPQPHRRAQLRDPRGEWPGPLRRLQPGSRRLRSPGERLVRRGRRHDLRRR